MGYNSQVVHMQGDPLGASFDMSLDIEPVANGAPFELDDVQFATKKSQLSPKAEVMLQALANRMERQPDAHWTSRAHRQRGIVGRQLGLERGPCASSEGLPEPMGWSQTD